MELIISGLFILAAFWLGYKAGKGESLEVNISKFKPVIRTEEQEVELIENMRKKK